jgi:peptidyl-prolyl isomerase G (cyclophilin G)
VGLSRRSPTPVRGGRSRRNTSRSPSPPRRAVSPANHGRSPSRSVSPDGSKRIKRGRGFTQRYSFARQYRSPSADRSHRYGGRGDRDR